MFEGTLFYMLEYTVSFVVARVLLQAYSTLLYFINTSTIILVLSYVQLIFPATVDTAIIVSCLVLSTSILTA